MIYFIRCCDFIKIGVSSQRHLRICDMQVGNPFELSFVATFDEPHSLEKRLHRALRSHRIRGEWFAADAANSIVNEAYALGSLALAVAAIEGRLMACAQRLAERRRQISADLPQAVRQSIEAVLASVSVHELADFLSASRRMIDKYAAGRGMPGGVNVVRLLSAFPNEFDPVLGLYGIQLSPLDSSDPIDSIDRMGDIVSRTRNHNETLGLATLLRPLMPKLTAIVDEADQMRGARP